MDEVTNVALDLYMCLLPIYAAMQTAERLDAPVPDEEIIIEYELDGVKISTTAKMIRDAMAQVHV